MYILEHTIIMRVENIFQCKENLMSKENLFKALIIFTEY